MVFTTYDSGGYTTFTASEIDKDKDYTISSCSMCGDVLEMEKDKGNMFFYVSYYFNYCSCLCYYEHHEIKKSALKVYNVN